jgi:hypothetical protein
LDKRQPEHLETGKRRVRIPWLLLMLLAAGLEAWLMGSWLLENMGRGAAWSMALLGELLIHTLLVGLGCWGLARYVGGSKGLSLAMVGLLIGFFFPVAGLPAMALMVLAQPGMARRAGLVNQFKHNISIQDRSGQEQVRVQDVVEFLADQVNIAPLADLVRSEDPRMRRGAIAALRKIKNPTAVKLLKEARGDTSPEMRVHAHVALTRLDNEMSGKLEKAMKLVELAPDDPQALMAQARASLDYIKSGLLEEAALGHYIGLARRPLSQLLQMEPGHQEALTMSGQLYLIEKKPARAQKAFEDLLQRHGHLPEGYLGLCEALFMQGKYKLMKRVAVGYRRAASGDLSDRQAVAATELWIS